MKESAVARGRPFRRPAASFIGSGAGQTRARDKTCYPHYLAQTRIPDSQLELLQRNLLLRYRTASECTAPSGFTDQ